VSSDKKNRPRAVFFGGEVDYCLAGASVAGAAGVAAASAAAGAATASAAGAAAGGAGAGAGAASSFLPQAVKATAANKAANKTDLVMVNSNEWFK